MKNIRYVHIAEAILIVGCLIGSMIKMVSASSTGESVNTFSFLGLSIFYFVGLPMLCHKNKISIGKIILCIFTALLFNVFLVGILFFVNDWPYTFEMVITAKLSIFFDVPVIAFAAFLVKDEKLTLFHLGIRTAVLSVIVLLISMFV
jgi:hypothetical protein